MTRCRALLVALLLAAPARAADPFDRDNLVAWCVVPFDAQKRSPEDRAAMLKRLRFTKFAYDWRAEHLPTFERELAALKKHGIELTAVWFPAGIREEGRLLLDALKKHRIKTQLWVMPPELKAPTERERLEGTAAWIRSIAREVEADGHTVGVYNHGGWAGEPENLVAVVKAADLPNVGIVYNLHHGHDHLDRFPDALRAMKPHLLCLNLNGMVKGGDKAGKKILPLGQGDRDLGLLKTIRDSGYRGPVGIIGHTQDDAEERLRDNLDGLDWLVPQLDGKAPGPKPTPRTLAALPWRVRLSAGEAPAVEVAGLTADELGLLRKTKEVNWPTVLKVVVGDGKTAIPGEYRVEGSVLRFTPRFPLTPGVTYRATFDPNPIPVHPGGELRTVTADLVVPKPKREPTTVITRVHPTAAVLPENTLRWYVHFSAPMTRGGAYKHVKLLCGEAEVSYPFLELDEELWTADGKRFTLLFDPGRVKRGLKPREEAGPVLEEGKKYTLVIDRAWEDENGVPLKESFRKSFAVGPPDDTPIDPEKWQITPPGERLTVKLEKPLDHALLHRMVWVVGPNGQKLAGTVEVPDAADAWSFRPAGGWPRGEYKLVIDTRLEDVCGNRVGRPFEVDVFDPVQKKVEGKTVERRFTVK
jgi:sugar phosphate isomerase/epimerase